MGRDTKIIKSCLDILHVSDKNKKSFLNEKLKLRNERQEMFNGIENNEINGGNEYNNDNIESNDSNRKNVLLDSVSDEEKSFGEVVKCALQIIGNLAFGCNEVQVFVYFYASVDIHASIYTMMEYKNLVLVVAILLNSIDII